MIPFKTPKFIKSAVKPSGYPRIFDLSGNPLPEIAVVGRSNVGKSSLINHLFRHGKMAKTSATPGKTQLLNFFSIDDRLAFVDLPGYGFARVPAKTKAAWGPMIEGYLAGREHLQLILFLFDIRRMPNEDDLRLLDWIIAYDKPMILVFTKIDKLKKGERKGKIDKILQAFPAENICYTTYSTTKNIGRKELISLIHEALEE